MQRFLSSEFIQGRRGPLLALCLPLICCCFMSLLGNRPRAMANVPDLPGLAFDQYLVDLREVAPTEEVFGYFGFRNTSQHTLTITKLEPSCGCLHPQLKKTVYKPGEGGEFLLRVKTALQQPGFKEFTVKVHYTDSKPRTRDVFLRITFPEKQIYITPRALTFHQSGTESVDQEVIMTDLRATPAEIIGVSSTSDLLKLEVLDPTTTKNNARQQRVRITLPGSVPSGKHSASILIYTNDEKFHELKVPIILFGPEKHSLTQRTIGPQMIGPVQR